MKLLAVEIVGFGKWQQQKITFESGNQLLYGANEVGKSTLYQFIQAMLFGFPTKGKRKRDYAPKNGGSYGGRLWLAHPVFGEVQVERFKEKNKGQAIIYYQQQMGDEKTLQQMLHPLTKKLFQEVFTFQQEQLITSDKLTEEELQTSLLAIGVSGSQQLLTYRNTYFKEAQKIFKGKGQQPLLNQKLAAYQELKEQIQEKEAQQQTFQQLEETIRETEQQRVTLQQQLKETQQDLLQVAEQQRHFPLYEEWQSLPEETENVVLVKEDQVQLEETFQEYMYLDKERQRLTKELSLQSEALDVPEGYAFYLEQEALIQQLLNQRYDMQQLMTESEWMTQTFEQNRQEMVLLENEWSWSPERPPQLFYDNETVQKWRQQQVAYTQALQKGQEQKAFLASQIENLEDQLTDFEKAHAAFFGEATRAQKAQKTSQPLWLLLGSILALLGFFLPSPLKWGLVLVGVSLIAKEVLSYATRKEASSDEVKEEWKTKLSQLDYLNEQFQQALNQEREAQLQVEQLEQSVAEQAQLHQLGKMNQIDTLMNQRELITRYLLLVQTNEELMSQLKENQQKRQGFEEQVFPLMTHLPLQGKSLSEKLHFLEGFAEEMEKVRFAQEYQADGYLKQQLRELKTKQQEALTRIQPLLIRYRILSIADVPIRIQQLTTQQAQVGRGQELATQLGNLFSEAVTEATLKDRSLQLAQQQALEESQLDKIQEQYQALIYEKQQLMTDGTLDELYQRQAILKAEIKELAQRWSGYQLAGQLLMDLLTELSEQQLPSLLQYASSYFALLTNQRYQSIQVAEGQLVAVTKEQEMFYLHELSTGTKDQLMMAVRFAFLAVQGEQLICPIIIDDGWLHYDHQRKAQLAELFTKFGQKQQVICFSSDQEMVSYYQDLQQRVIALEGGSVK